MLEYLPEDVLGLIAIDNNQTWFNLVRTCKYFQKFSDQDDLKQKFLRMSSDNNWKIKYTLPNGDVHTFDDPCIYSDGTKEWYQNGNLHRDNDQPAIICPNGDREWYQNGNLHRDNDQPAAIYSSGTRHWY